jgi:acyl-CoA synthetase (NDP forming)
VRGVPCFSTPGRTARAIGAAVEYAEFLRGADDVAVLHERAAPAAWPQPPGPLSESAARTYLAPLGMPSPPQCLVTSADEAVASFETLGGRPVALKIQSPDIAHKTDIGGVHLGLRSAADVKDAFDEIMRSARSACPDASIEGVLVQHMAPRGVEAFVAARQEPLLGPLVVVGLGGLDVEATRDVAMRLAPVSSVEARAMLRELRGYSVLLGSRGRPPADVEALADSVVHMSELAAALPAGVANVEINPLLVLPAGEGVLMLDAAVELVEGEEDAD